MKTLNINSMNEEDIKILIVEDESLQANKLKRLLETKGYFVCELAYNEQTGIDYLKKYEPDLAIIDINLEDHKNTGGINIGKWISQQQFPIPHIYITTHEEYYEKAKITNPYAWINKITFSDEDKLRTVELALTQSPFNKYIFIPDGKTYKKIQLLSISKIITDKNFPQYQNIFVTFLKEPIPIKIAMVKLKKILPENAFVQVSKNTMINMTHSTEIKNNRVTCNKEKIEISDAYREEVFQALAKVGLKEN